MRMVVQSAWLYISTLFNNSLNISNIKLKNLSNGDWSFISFLFILLITIRNSKYKFAMLSLKYIPLCMFISMWVHTILLNFNIDPPFAESIMGCALFPCILILSLSGVFKFCFIHKLMIMYSLIVDLCINFERYIGFGILLKPLRLIISIAGSIIFLILMVNYKEFRHKCVRLNIDPNFN